MGASFDVVVFVQMSVQICFQIFSFEIFLF